MAGNGGRAAALEEIRDQLANAIELLHNQRPSMGMSSLIAIEHLVQAIGEIDAELGLLSRQH